MPRTRSLHRNEPLQTTDLPGRPWEKVALDLFEIHRKHFIVIVDYYSCSIEVKLLSSTSSAAVIGRCKEVFALHVVPDVFISDNSPQYVSEEFRCFARKYGFSHQTSSQHFHQANGEAESAVKIAKKIVSQQDADIALLNYHHGARTLQNIDVGQPVKPKLDTETSWNATGQVVKVNPSNCTCIVETSNGNQLCQNSKQRQMILNPPVAKDTIDIDDPEFVQPPNVQAKVDKPELPPPLPEPQPTIQKSSQIITKPSRYNDFVIK